MPAIFAFLSLLGCVNTPQTVAPTNTIQLGDPLFVEGAPKLVSFKETSVVTQPSPGAYPQDAVNRGIHGDVLVEIWMDTEGVPTKVAALWGPKELHTKALSYAHDWRFKPVMIEGKPAPVRFRMVMPFHLIRGGIYQGLPKELVY